MAEPLKVKPDRTVVKERLYWALDNVKSAHDWLLDGRRALTPAEEEIIEQIESELKHLRTMGHG